MNTTPLAVIRGYDQSSPALAGYNSVTHSLAGHAWVSGTDHCINGPSCCQCSESTAANMASYTAPPLKIATYKFAPEDKAFFLTNNKVMCLPVRSAVIEVFPDRTTPQYTLQDRSTSADNTIYHRAETELFATKEELLKSL